MKPLVTLTLFTLLAGFHCLATIRTVSNNPLNPAQFQIIQAAVDAAVSGDTIYVNASALIYNEIVFITNKRLVMIGAGYQSSNQFGFTTSVNNFGLSNASGTVICGFDLNGLSSFDTPSSSDVRVFRNNIGSLAIQGGSNWVIYNNFITFLQNNAVTTTSFLSILNNIFRGFMTIQGNASTVVVDHNLFLNSSPGGYGFNNIQFATITNNIFVSSNPRNFIDGGTKFNNFNNNLSLFNTLISANPPTNSFAGGPNAGGGNFVGVNPLFVNVTDNDVYDRNANYRLQSGSPVKNAGTDGTDIGIYGGSYPFPSGGAPGSGFDTSAPPPIPQVTSVNVQNSSLTPGTQLRVTIQATVTN